MLLDRNTLNYITVRKQMIIDKYKKCNILKMQFKNLKIKNIVIIAIKHSQMNQISSLDNT